MLQAKVNYLKSVSNVRYYNKHYHQNISTERVVIYKSDGLVNDFSITGLSALKKIENAGCTYIPSNVVVSGLTGPYASLNGTYTPNGLVNGVQSWQYAAAQGTIIWSGIQWRILLQGGIFVAANNGVSTVLPATGWSASSGTPVLSGGVGSLTGFANSSTTNLTKCNNVLPYTWNGLIFTTAGTQTAHLTNSKGCDSAATLVLTINDTSASKITYTACGSYTWHNSTYTKTGSYTFDTLNAAGCDSLVTLNLTINDSVKITQQPVNTPFCVGNNAFYTIVASGTGLIYNWQTTGLSANNWTTPSGGAWVDSTTNKVTVRLENINPIYNITHTRCIIKGICNSDTSIIFVPIVLSPSHSKPDTIINCGNSYNWHSKTYSSTGTYYDTLAINSIAGCDSIATLNLTLNPSPTIYTLSGGGSYCAGSTGVPVTLNGSQTSVHYSVFVNGILSPKYKQGTGSALSGTLQNPGTYTMKATDTVTGCTADMTGSVTVIVHQPTSSVANINNCGSYLFNGKTYTTSGTFKDTLKGANSAGCDSIITLNLTITTPLTPSISISVPSDTICWHTGVTFTPTVTNAGNNISYQWILNHSGGSSYVDGTGSTYSKGMWLDGDAVKCVITINSSGCYSTNMDTSNTITIHVTPDSLAKVSIVASDTSICAGSRVTFTATPVRGGKTPTYNWIVNNSKLVSYGSDTFSIAGLNNNDVIYCILNSSACTPYNAGPAQSNIIYEKVSPVVTPSVSITTNSSTICSGIPVTITATPVNGGSAPVYEFKVNGYTVQQNSSATYTSRSLASGDVVSCVMKANNTCMTIDSAISGNITFIKITPVIISNNSSNCNSLVYKGITYNSSTVLHDTLKSVGGCDSVYLTTVIVIKSSIAGNIIYPKNNISIPKVKVIMTGDSSFTGEFNGKYNIGCLSSQSHDIVHLNKNNDVTKANGVTAIDIALVQSHILAKNLLNSPYKILAADVNGDGKVTALDIVYLKRLILGVDTTFTNITTKQNRLWAFVDSSYKFPDTTNPFPLKDSIVVTGLNTNKTNQTFIGMKLGDVNWDWNPAIARPQVNNIDAVELSYSSDYLKSSDEIRIPIKVKNFVEMTSMQFTISFDAGKLQYLGIGNNPLGIETGTNHAADGSVSFLWVDPKSEAKTLEDGSVVFELVFKKTGKEATGKEAIENSLVLNSSVTTIAAYDKDYNLHGIVMKPSLINVNDVVTENWTVSPNPVTGGTIHVNMNLKDNKAIVLRLLDNTGKVILVKQVVGIKGKNTLAISLKNHLNFGTYFIQAVGIEGETAKKIIAAN